MELPLGGHDGRVKQFPGSNLFIYLNRIPPKGTKWTRPSRRTWYE
jgi:hypothetical protein